MSSGEMVLMQTAQCSIRNPINGLNESARMLLDLGSQRTYITETLARKLNLQMGELKEITRLTFGSERAKTIRATTTVLDIELKDRSLLSINANVVPSIIGSIQRHPFNFSALRNIKYLMEESSVADKLPKEIKSSQIELLIGTNYSLDITLPQKIEIRPIFYLLGSKLGYVLA